MNSVNVENLPPKSSSGAVVNMPSEPITEEAVASTQPTPAMQNSASHPPQAAKMVYLVVDGPDYQDLMNAYFNREHLTEFKIVPGALIPFDETIRDALKEELSGLPEIVNAGREPQGVLYPIFDVPLSVRLVIEGITPEREQQHGYGIIATVHELVDHSAKYQSGTPLKDNCPANFIKQKDRVRLSYNVDAKLGGFMLLTESRFLITSHTQSNRIYRPRSCSLYIISQLAHTHPVSSMIDMVGTANNSCQACPYYTDAHPTA